MQILIHFAILVGSLPIAAKESESLAHSDSLQNKDMLSQITSQCICIVQLYCCGHSLWLNSSFCSQSCSAYMVRATEGLLLCPRRFYAFEEVMFFNVTLVICSCFCTLTTLKLLPPPPQKQLFHVLTWCCAIQQWRLRSWRYLNKMISNVLSGWIKKHLGSNFSKQWGA